MRMSSIERQKADGNRQRADGRSETILLVVIPSEARDLTIV
jgi:hypothetical protein